MDNALIWPLPDMNFWKIENGSTTVTIKWTHNYFEDYRSLAHQFYECGYMTFDEVIKSGHNNVKTDMWFLTGIFMVRHSIELGLKALLCRVLSKNNSFIQNAFEECCHDVSKLFQKYYETGFESFLTDEEIEWLTKYLASLENVDKKSDLFRFPFEDDFLSKYKGKFLDTVAVANNLLQGFALVNKCMAKGYVSKEDEFDDGLIPEFFVFASHGFGNCYLWQPVSDDGFHTKVTGYSEVIDFIYQSRQISNEKKLYPLLFMFRNTIELCLKRIFYSKVDNGVPESVFFSKRKSHLIKKELWKNVKPVIEKYAIDFNYDISLITVVENLMLEIDSLDKNGENFRYPTSYSLEYRIDNKKIDLVNIYTYLKAITNFLDGCDSMLDVVEDYQSEIKAEYEAEMRASMDWY